MSAPRISNPTSFPDSLVVGDLTFQSSKNLGVTFNMHLTVAAHVVNLIRTNTFELRSISSICHYSMFKLPKLVFPLSFFLDWTVVIASSLDVLHTF